jgi:hypothetical protein
VKYISSPNDISVAYQESFAVGIVIFSGIFLLTISGFLIFHIYLIFKGFTTNEYIRGKVNTHITDNNKNQNKEKYCQNFQEIFCE